MNKCPVCNSKIEEKNQKHCSTCAWELEWFLGDLREKTKKEYFNKLKIHKEMYLKSINGDGNGGTKPPPCSGFRCIFVGIYLFVKYFIKSVSWLILLGLLVGVFSFIFKQYHIAFESINSSDSGALVGLGIFILITGIYMYKKFSK